MLVDCQTCPVRDVHCADCVVTALAAIPIHRADGSFDQPFGIVGRSGPGSDPAGDHLHATEVERTAPLDRAERRAVSALLAAGLVSTTAANSARAVMDAEMPVARQRGARHAV